MKALLLFLALSQDADAKAAALISELRTEETAARRKAHDGLAAMGRDAVPMMLRVLADEAPGVPERVEELVRRLSEREWKGRDEAMRSLVRLGQRAVEHLKRHAEAADAEVSWRVRTALAEIEEQKGREQSLDHLRNASLCELLGMAGDATCVSPLLGQLTGSGSGEVRLRAAEALGRLRGVMSAAQADEASDEVIKLLSQNRERRDRNLYVKALGQLGSASSVRPLVGLLDDPAERDVHLKRNVMAALASIGDAAGVAAVVRMLPSESAYLREGAIAALEPMAGGSHGFDPRREGKANEEAVAKVRAWWEKKFGKSWE